MFRFALFSLLSLLTVTHGLAPNELFPEDNDSQLWLSFPKVMWMQCGIWSLVLIGVVLIFLIISYECGCPCRRNQFRALRDHENDEELLQYISFYM